jgi:hypothetical protein
MFHHVVVAPMSNNLLFFLAGITAGLLASPPAEEDRAGSTEDFVARTEEPSWQPEEVAALCQEGAGRS